MWIPVKLCSLGLAALTAVVSAPQQKDFDVTLSVPADFARIGELVTLKLEIKANADAKLDSGLLNGASVEVSVNGGQGKRIGVRSTKTVDVKKGSKISVQVPVDIGRLIEASESTAQTVVEFRIPGTKEAHKVTFVRDFKGVDVGQLDLAKTRVALVTNFGTMVVKFRPDKAPNTVKNFIKLAKERYYDGTRFHRVLRGFMIQGGDPNTRDDNPMNDGQGGPGYQIDAEFNDIKHVRGVLSMARSGDPNSAGSQFFVMHGKAPHLDGKYTAFGRLESGLDVLDRITDIPVKRQPGGMETSRPTQDVWLIRAIVLGVTKS